jgi:cysteine desulfurase
LCAEHLATCGWDVSYIGCDSQGVIDLDEFEASIRASTRIASVVHASHRIGTIQPIEEISEICQKRDVLLHTDAAQSIGKISAQVDQLGVDLLSLSGHKFYAPKGIGALYVRTGVPIEPITFGEGCEAGLRPGTANVPHIVGLGQAAKMVAGGLDDISNQLTRLRDLFLCELERAIGKSIVVHGAGAPRLPTLLSLELPGVTAEEIQQRLPEVCFGPSAANGNGSRNGRTSNLTHAAMGLNQQQSAGAIRVSFGWTTTEEEIRQATQMIATAYDALAR